MKRLGKVFMVSVLSVVFGLVFFTMLTSQSGIAPAVSPSPHILQPVFEIRSVDTMKYSRDLARAYSSDSSADAVIDRQVSEIADLGVTHIAIATPYEEEFVPYLSRWVASARSHGLKVWFRGNLAGWEKWFGYPPVSREDHLSRLPVFIKSHGSLFEDGDIFTPCPECENGGPGDPRDTGDVAGFRQFLISSREGAKAAFEAIGKNVSVDVQSMNYDIATLIMDRDTTGKLGGIVGIDHYVKDPGKLGEDAKVLADKSGGKIFLSEFGAPIPDINGRMTPQQQSEWIRNALESLSNTGVVNGVNYWVNVGGSTEIWDKDGNAKDAVSVLKEYYSMLR